MSQATATKPLEQATSRSKDPGMKVVMGQDLAMDKFTIRAGEVVLIEDSALAKRWIDKGLVRRAADDATPTRIYQAD